MQPLTPPTPEESARNWRRLAWLLFGAALVMRLWGIDYGLPHIYWMDEYHEVMRALELGAGGFNFARTSKGGFYLLLFMEYGTYFVLMKISGAVAGTKEFAELFVRDPTAFYLLGRTTAAGFGAATILAVAWVARRAYDDEAGILAALFLAVNVLHVDVSHRVGVDVPMTFLASVALYFAVKIAADGGRRDYLLAAVFAALATTTKLPGILLVVPLLIAHTYHVGRTPQGLRKWFASADLWLAFAVFTVVLFATNPGIVFQLDQLVGLSPSPGDLPDDLEADDVGDMGPGERPNLYAFYLLALRASMGWPLFALCLLAFAYAAWRRKPADVVLISFAVANYVAIASTSSDILYYPRYALPIVVVLVILGGRLLADTLRWVPHLRVAALGAAACLMAAWPLVQSAANSYVLSQTDTRTLAKDWVQAAILPGSRVLIEGGKIAPSRETVPLEDSPSSLERRIAYWRSIEPRQAKYLEIKRAVHSGGGYELEIFKGNTAASLDEYLGRGIAYFVVRPDSLLNSRRSSAPGVQLMRSLRTDSRVKLLKAIPQEPGRRPGPTIEIYMAAADASAER